MSTKRIVPALLVSSWLTSYFLSYIVKAVLLDLPRKVRIENCCWKFNYQWDLRTMSKTPSLLCYEIAFLLFLLFDLLFMFYFAYFSPLFWETDHSRGYWSSISLFYPLIIQLLPSLSLCTLFPCCAAPSLLLCTSAFLWDYFAQVPHNSENQFCSLKNIYCVSIPSFFRTRVPR